MSRNPPGQGARVVFVGNIPYDTPEESLKEVFSEVGPVISIRLVNDRETGKLKGYGFVEYGDAATAASAVRNLNGYEIGGRQLRIDYSENEKILGGGEKYTQGTEDKRDRGEKRERSERYRDRGHTVPAPIAPSGPRNSAQDQVTAVLAAMPEKQVIEMISQMKGLIQRNPQEARVLLLNNPQLGYALMQGLIMMGLLTDLPQSFPQAAQSVGAPVLPPGGAPPNFPLPTARPPQGMLIPGAMPDGPGMAEVQAQTAAVLRQLMTLTPQQINALPPEHRAQIDQLRTQLGQQ